MNRLTISVTVHYTNTLEPKKSADINASRFADYRSAQDLSAVETQLVQDISKQLAHLRQDAGELVSKLQDTRLKTQVVKLLPGCLEG